ncbi:MAG: hypothetical protein QXO71_06755 [Candidatus Jordarchaeaceae archaeon]
MVDIDWNLDEGVIENLNHILDVDLREIIDDFPSEESLVEGDRVIYSYKGDAFKRRDPTIDYLRRFADELTQDLDKIVGKGKYELEFEPPSPPPEGRKNIARMVDVIPFFTWGVDHLKYAKSPNFLPSEDWQVDWLLGVLFKSVEADIVYLDFRNPKVKVVVAGCLYFMYDSIESNEYRKKVLVNSFLKAKELKRKYQSFPSIKWAKVVFSQDQDETYKAIITTMDLNGNINIEETNLYEKI